MKKLLFIFSLILIQGLYFSTCFAVEDLTVLTPNHQAKLTSQITDENKLLVSALDAEGNPIRGLGVNDFIIESGKIRAKIFTVETLETNEDIPLNLVLVVDNSFSMSNREAVEPLLTALEEFLKIIRPIDNIHIVVFDKKGRLKVSGHTLHAKTFSSNIVSEIRTFLRESFDKGLTGYTYLYEAMVAGIDLVQKMPEKSNKFLVVFSDGEDLNSAFRRGVVKSEAKGIANFEAYAVDYMPGASVSSFLKSFTKTHGGRVWKAASKAELTPIFKSFTTTLLHRYVVTYTFHNPPKGILTAEPTKLNYDLLTLTDGSPILNQVFFETGKSELPREYVLFKGKTETRFFDEKSLKTALDRYYNVLNIVGKRLGQNPKVKVRIVGCNSSVGAEKGDLDLSLQRAETVKSYLNHIWSVDKYRMEVGIRNLPTRASQTDVLGGRAENQRVEIQYESAPMQQGVADEFIVEAHNASEIKIYPQIEAENGINTWELHLFADNQTIKTLTGTGELKPFYAFPLNEFGIGKIATSHNIRAVIKVTDTLGDTHETAPTPVVVTSSSRGVIHDLIHPPSGQVAMEPSIITIQELTMIESSPMLNHVFFKTGKSEIPERYALFASRAQTKNFSDKELRGTMQKYYNVLNVVGKRLRQFPEASIKIVGCNSGSGIERGRRDLSQGRAESVRAYLKYIWGVGLSRMTVEARNRPAAASANGTDKGRSDNQRVEIYSNFPAIMAPIKSTYVEEMSDTEMFRVFPKIAAGYGVSHWKIELTGDGTTIASISGQGDLNPFYTFDLNDIGFQKISSFNEIKTSIEVTDVKGQIYRDAAAAASSVRFVKREEHIAQKSGYKVLEKYALVLFDFNSSIVNGKNLTIVNQIVDRMNEFPKAEVEVVGYTDNIGEEAYNLWLSARRAKSVFDQIMPRVTVGKKKISHVGLGLSNPLYDNNLPEGRALNRTVTVALEYEKDLGTSLSSTKYD
jgi:outer membrane protein OmpA-like peptidoglycan-associated protein